MVKKADEKHIEPDDRMRQGVEVQKRKSLPAYLEVYDSVGTNIGIGSWLP